MKILAIETSCDETSAAIAEKKGEEEFINILSNVTASSLALHAKTGGIIPERAAREQIKYIIPVIVEALLQSKTIYSLSKVEKLPLHSGKRFLLANEILKKEIDAIAVTVGPGLIGSLLVGTETAKTLSHTFNKPIIPVNHLLAHIYANFISENSKLNAKRYPLDAIPTFPFIGLIVSGGHTDLLLFKSHKNFKWLGGTRDDAAGEAMDKIARILGLAYPGGPEIEKRAKKGQPNKFQFKSPMIETEDFDFSFSGLKTQVSREISTMKQKKHLHGGRTDSSDGGLKDETINNICYAVQKAIIDVLVKKTINAALKYKISTILLGGGVSINQALRDEFELNARRYTLNAKLFSPEKEFCTDNAAMIASYSLLAGKPKDWQKITAEPELYFE